MLVLCIRTDKPESELYLFSGDTEVSRIIWEAHRQLGKTIHLKIKELMAGGDTSLRDIEKIVVFEGPGSFTGLRIGMSVANALAYGLAIPLVGSTGENWIQHGLNSAGSTNPVQPVYGSEAHITQPRK